MRAKNFIISITLASMVYQPIALAQQNQKWAGQTLKEFVKANQVNGKPVTYKKFWDQNKKGVSPYWQRVFTPSMEMQKDQSLPKMEVIDIKGPQGTSAERMIMNIDGKTVSVEYLGGQEKFARINSTVISYADFYYVTGMIEKLSKDPVFANETKKLQQKVLTKSATPTYEQYKNMNATERGQLLLMARLAGEAASDVLLLAAKAEEKKTASNFFWDVLLPQANASVVGLPCLVGGYEGKIARQSGRTFCDPTAGIVSFNNDPKNKKLVESSGCKGNSFGCHPVNFPASTGICFSKENRQSMQNMTKQCGDKSPYKTPQDQAKLIEAYQKRLGTSTDVKLNAEGKVLDEKTYNEAVKPYMDQFNELNRSAYEKVCNQTNRAKVSLTVDPEIDSACDTLEQRKIALELFIASPRPEPTPVPPIAGGEDCTAEGGKPGKKDNEGKCIPLAVAGPADPCAPKGLQANPAVGKIPTRTNGEKDCMVPAATERLPGTTPPVAQASSGSWWSSFSSSTVGKFVIGGGIIALIALLFNKWSKGTKPAPPIPATDPASPGGLPPAPIQPTNPPPAGEIEGGSGQSPVGTGGQR